MVGYAKNIGALCGVLIIAASAASGASAQSAAEFYKDKDIKLVVAAGSGGTYAVYARLLARHWKQYIPGNPTVIIQHMPGGGGLKGAGYLQNAAARDGSVIGMPLQTVAAAQVLRPQKAKHDVRQWQWIGNMTVLRNTVGAWHTSGVKTVEDARRKEIIIGSTGRGGDMFMVPKLANEMLGTKFKIVLGYRGIRDVDKALEGGEVQGRAGSWLSWKLSHADWIRDGKVTQLMQVGFSRAPDLPDVPLMQELATNDRDRKVLEFFSLTTRMARSVTALPETPAYLVAALRTSFDAAMKDKALVAEAAKRGVPLEPMGWKDVEAAARATAGVDKAVLAHMQAVLARK